MIQIVMKPDKAPVVNREGLYVALFNGEDIGMRVRALRASHAEEKVMEMLRHSIDKAGGRLLVDYNLEQWKERKSDKAQEPAAEAGEAHEEAGVRGAEAPQVHQLPDDDNDEHA